jgi:hypothetical protein
VRDDIVQARICADRAEPEATKTLLEAASDKIEKLLRLITQIERPWEKQGETKNTLNEFKN